MTNIISEYQGRPIDAYDADIVEEMAVQYAPSFIYGDRPVVIEFEPGNGTRYVLVFTPLDDIQSRVVGNTWLLSLPNFDRCYPINVPGRQTPGYVAEKWCKSTGDAVPIAHLLNSLWEQMKIRSVPEKV